MADFEIEIDGQKLKAQPNQMLIEVADAAGIYIPRFCYHKSLSIAANCRMCLVEVEKVGKPLPACATPVSDGMKVFTKSQKAIEAQRAVMEFLLVNHPLDCPICDQGGECELQDLAMGYGSSHSEYDECKRSVADPDIGPLVATGLTRCIHCTRCVRFGDEVAGMRELGMTFRGEHAEIGTYVKHAMQSEISGNIIDLCPVGALTAKPYRFTARSWEMQQSPAVSPHDCLGTNINVHTLYGSVKRVVSRENNDVNQCWITDRDRFSYVGLEHDDRVKEPMIKKDGKWHTVGWEEAFEIAASNIQASIEANGADQFGSLASPSATVEELYLLQKMTRALGSTNVDVRLRETDDRDQVALGAFPGMQSTPKQIAESDAIILIGSNLQKELPLIAVRVREAIKNGATVIAINPVDYTFNFHVHGKLIPAPQNMAKELADVLAAAKKENVSARTKSLVEKIAGKENVAVIVGELAMHHPDASVIRSLASQLAAQLKGKLNLITDGANSAGAWLVGAVPHQEIGGKASNRIGKSANDMLSNGLNSYVLLNVEPDFDCANVNQAKYSLAKADFVVALATYRSAAIEEHADVILPVSAFTESAGTYVNAMGMWQAFTGAAKPCCGSRPAWKILRVLGNFLHLEGFEQDDIDQVRKEIKAQVSIGVKPAAELPAVKVGEAKVGVCRVGEVPIYSVDALSRRSMPLQQAQAIMLKDFASACVHPETAKKLQLNDGDQVVVKQGEGKATLPLVCDKRIAEDAVWVAAGIEQVANLGSLFGNIEIQKA